MIQQEINLPFPIIAVLLVLLIILLIIVASKKITETIELPEKKEPDKQAMRERYGAYIQAQGKYYN